jgi:glycosyltransferase involved in cell wall biosynthesis
VQDRAERSIIEREVARPVKVGAAFHQPVARSTLVSPEHVKILRIIARLNVGGPARHVALLNAGLNARGHETLLIHGELDHGEASLEQFARDRGVRMVKLEALGRRVSPTSDIFALAGLHRLIRDEQPDVIHTHTAKAGTLGRLAALAYNATRPRSRRALVVHTFHGHVFEGYFSPAANHAIRTIERTLAQVTDTIITISPRQRTDIVERFRIASPSRTVIVPLGLDLDPLLELRPGAGGMRATLGIAPAEVVVGYAGRLVPVKDLDTLVQAFARACGRVPGLRLVLAGDGPERPRLESLARTLGIADRTHFVGWVASLPDFYAALDLFALSSINEGTPVAAIEAMAAGRPVVATAVGGVPDVIAHDVSGWLVPARSIEAFADALVFAAGSSEARQTLGAAARNTARDRYSDRRLVDDVERLYSKRLHARRSRG